VTQWADYVNPNIGTVGHLLTSTSQTVSLPHGMMKAAPITTPGIATHGFIRFTFSTTSKA
jgi:hypothetical protein